MTTRSAISASTAARVPRTGRSLTLEAASAAVGRRPMGSTRVSSGWPAVGRRPGTSRRAPRSVSTPSVARTSERAGSAGHAKWVGELLELTRGSGERYDALDARTEARAGIDDQAAAEDADAVGEAPEAGAGSDARRIEPDAGAVHRELDTARPPAQADLRGGTGTAVLEDVLEGLNAGEVHGPL